MNPLVPWQKKNDPYAVAVLLGKDKNCAAYVAHYAQGFSEHPAPLVAPARDTRQELRDAILYGLQESIYPLIDTALKEGLTAQEINTQLLLPALEEVGEKFVTKHFFLPQVLLSADTMQKGFMYLQSQAPQIAAATRGVE